MSLESIHVVVAVPVESQLLEMLSAISPRIRISVLPPDGGKANESALNQCEVLYTLSYLPEPELVPRLRWVQAYSAGIDTMLTHPLFAGEVALCTASGLHTIAMPEFAMMALLALARKLPLLLDNQRQALWPRDSFNRFTPRELHGSTLGIVGYGSIGRQIARLAKSFGMRILAMKRQPTVAVDPDYTVAGLGDPEGALPDHIYSPSELLLFLAVCDFVVLVVPLTPETHHLIDAEALAAMKREAFLINLARGEVVDADALIGALKAGRIAGAWLDVFEQEPLPSDSPLWHTPNLVISPHISGASAHFGARSAAVFAENLRRYLQGEPLLNRVDKQRGY